MTTNTSAKLTPAVASLWLLAALWTGLVLWAGSDSLSAPNTSRFLVPFIRWLLPDMETMARWEVIFAIRKGAHLIEYAVLAWLTWLALFSTYRRSLLRLAGLALAWVLVVAALDETRQSLLDSRTGSIVDVGIDVAGGILALALAVAYTRYMQRTRGAVKAG